jgi:predicted aspartyl protease
MKDPNIVALSAALALLPICHMMAHAQDPPAAPRAKSRVRPPAPALSGDRGDIEMHAKEGIPTVTVTVNGRGPYRFGIDTGAEGYARVSTRLATELELTPVGEIMTGDPSGRSRQTMPVYSLARVGLGNLTFTEVSAPQLALADAVDGMLGLELFHDLLLTLDFGRARLLAVRGELPAPDGATVLNYTPGPRGSVQLPLRIGDVNTVLNLDTGGARTGMALPPQKLAQVATRGEPRVIGRAKTVSQEFEISSVELAAPVTFGTVTLPINSVSTPSPDPIGVIGSDALRAMAVTIDQRNKRVRIVPSDW